MIQTPNVISERVLPPADAVPAVEASLHGEARADATITNSMRMTFTFAATCLVLVG